METIVNKITNFNKIFFRKISIKAIFYIIIILMLGINNCYCQTNTAIQNGNNSVQNNYFILPDNSKNIKDIYSKPREVTDSFISLIISKLPNKQMPISVKRRSPDSESFEFASRIVSALQKKGYRNSFVNGMVNDQVVGGDSEKEMKRQKEIAYEVDNWGQFDIIIPSN